MDLAVIFGPPAVGKATIGRHIAELTGFSLLHNNMPLDLVRQFFPRGTPGFALYPEINTRIIETAAENGGPSIVFTVAWNLDAPEDWDLMKRRTQAVESTGGRVFYLELCASLEERIRRNALPDRVAAKPLQAAELSDEIMHDLNQYRLNSGGDFPLTPYIYVDTERMTSRETAEYATQLWSLGKRHAPSRASLENRSGK